MSSLSIIHPMSFEKHQLIFNRQRVRQQVSDSSFSDSQTITTALEKHRKKQYPWWFLIQFLRCVIPYSSFKNTLRIIKINLSQKILLPPPPPPFAREKIAQIKAVHILKHHHEISFSENTHARKTHRNVKLIGPCLPSPCTRTSIPLPTWKPNNGGRLQCCRLSELIFQNKSPIAVLCGNQR